MSRAWRITLESGLTATSEDVERIRLALEMTGSACPPPQQTSGQNRTEPVIWSRSCFAPERKVVDKIVDRYASFGDRITVAPSSNFIAPSPRGGAGEALSC